MGTIQVDGTDYSIMGASLDEADAYLKAGVGAGGDAWRALITAEDDDGRARLLVSATRLLARQRWQGTKTVSTQATAFPRDSVTGPDGEAVEDGTTPQALIDAEYELAGLLAADASIATAANSGSNIASLTAGPVAVTYFQPTISVAAGATKMPAVIMDLVGPYLASAINEERATVYGVDDCVESAFDECAQYTRTGPLV
jgi:hypothetical protein